MVFVWCLCGDCVVFVWCLCGVNVSVLVVWTLVSVWCLRGIWSVFLCYYLCRWVRCLCGVLLVWTLVFVWCLCGITYADGPRCSRIDLVKVVHHSGRTFLLIYFQAVRWCISLGYVAQLGIDSKN